MGHQHGGWAGRCRPRHRARLWSAFALLAALMVAEALTALGTGSLALLSDAGHMFTDVLGIGMALAAMTAAGKATRDPQRTFGLYRLEVLAALANAVLLAGVALYVIVKATLRFDDPPEIRVGPMLVVAIAGLLANLGAFALLRSAAQESINVRGAYLEVLGDLLGSVGVITAAGMITLTGWWWVDPLVAVAIGLVILPRTWRLGRSAIRVLVQAAPAHLDVAAVHARLSALPGVVDVHDLHLWTLTPGLEVSSAHLRLDPGTEVSGVLDAAQRVLRDEFHIEHATLQVEPGSPPPGCRPGDR